MYQFPKGLYTDVRLEKNFSTQIVYENFQLTQNKQKTEQGAFIRVFDGARWYYSATTDIFHIQEEIDKLAKMATPMKNIAEHPVVARFEVHQGKDLRYVSNAVHKIEKQEKKALLDSYMPVLQEREDLGLITRGIYLDKYIEKRIVSSKGTDITFDMQTCAVALRYSFQVDGKPFHGSSDIIKEDFSYLAGHQQQVRENLESDYQYRLHAVPVEPGKYTCVLAPEVTGVFAHESFGHKSEADFMVGDETMMRDWAIGTRVGSQGLNILDTGTVPGAGFVPYDDEGCKAKENYIIKNGILVGRLHSSFTAAALQEPVTGNARAMNFEYEPIVRMTTTYIGAGTLTKDALIAGVEDGIYIDNINHGSGMSTFTIAPRKAYRIRNGKIAEPLEIAVITGNVMETLKEIDGFSDKVELTSFALGGCGKMEQYPLPVGFGGPYIRVKNIHVQ